MFVLLNFQGIYCLQNVKVNQGLPCEKSLNLDVFFKFKERTRQDINFKEVFLVQREHSGEKISMTFIIKKASIQENRCFIK